jgi:hypothetical protein
VGFLLLAETEPVAHGEAKSEHFIFCEWAAVRDGTAQGIEVRHHSYQRRRNIPELLRVGLSHYLTAEAAAAYLRQPGSQVARVTLSTSLPAHVARTFSRTNPLHVTVWARADLLVAHASVVRGGAEGLR